LPSPSNDEIAFASDEVVQNQKDGCPLCRRYRYNFDGTETEYRLKAH
jgi:hypothetical protein